MKKKSYWYLNSYKGFVFFTGVYSELQLPQDIDLVITKKLWLPYVLAE